MYSIYSRREMMDTPVRNSNGLGSFCIFLCLILVSVFQVCAQESQNIAPANWSLDAGIYGNRAVVIDKSFTSDPYSGVTAGLYLSARYQKNRSTHELRWHVTKGNLETGSPANSDLNQVYVAADYGWLREIGTNGHSLFAWKAGTGISAMYAKRVYDGFINNNESFELATSLSAILEGRYFFHNRPDGFSIANRIYFPLVSFVAQPEFGQEGSLWSSATDYQVTAFSSFFRICNFLSLEKKLSQNRKISLFYGWDYYQIRRERAVKQGAHRLGVAYDFAL